MTALVIMLIASLQLHASDSRESLVSDNGGTIQKILVLGAVHNPGFYPIKQGNAIRLKTAIEISGGLTNEAEESGIRILRPKPNESGNKKEDYTILLPGSLPDGEQNPELLPKDIVWIPPKAAQPKRLTEEEISSLKRESLHEIEMQKNKIAELKSTKP